MHPIRKSEPSTNEFFDGRHRFEHWYRDNTVYFITARCKDKFPAFDSEAAKSIFWDRFDHYAAQHHFHPFITTLMNNHYHTLGYLQFGAGLGKMMQKLHGSVAKLVNDLLPIRITPFWRDSIHKDYFDGCIRDVLQLERAYRYTQLQVVRAGICEDWKAYPHTRVRVHLERAIAKSMEMKVFLADVPYARYEERKRRKQTR